MAGDERDADVAGLAVPSVGALRETGDPWEPFQLVDPAGVLVAPVAAYLRDVQACGRSEATIRSYGMDLLRWFRFCWAAGLAWDQVTRAEAGEFCRWLRIAGKPTGPHWRARRAGGDGEAAAAAVAGGPLAGSPDAVTGRPAPGRTYAVATVAHCETVLRHFYDFHLESGSGPMVNPFPLDRGRAGRAGAHHNPMEPYPRRRSGLFRPRVAQRAPRRIPDEQFSELFARLSSHRDRALVAFWVSTGARASELLGATAGDADAGQQLITVIRKGTRVMQPLPASPDAFVWLRLYQAQMHGLVPGGADQPLWWTLRRPFRQLTYHAALRMFTRAGAALGAGWTLHDLRHTAAYRMARDPAMPLADIQWVLGHARLSTTQLYLNPVPDDVIASVAAFHARRARPQPAPGRRLPAGDAEDPFRGNAMTGPPPAPAPSLILTRVCDGAAAPEASQVMRQFPPRPRPGAWPATGLDREQVSGLLLADPFPLDSYGAQRQRAASLKRVLDWLVSQPGATWQERWTASGAEGTARWRDLVPGFPRRGHGPAGGLLLLICGDVIRPDAGWLLESSGLRLLTAEMARTRDPAGFTRLRKICETEQISELIRDLSLRRIAAIMAAKGGAAGGITAGDCLELASAVSVIDGPRGKGMYFYQLLRAAGGFPPAAPASVRMFATRGQLSPAELIGRYGIECRPVRDLLVDYLQEHQLAVDYATLRAMAHALGSLFWRDLERHHPGISSLRLSPAVAAGWKQRITRKPGRAPAGADGSAQTVPRASSAGALFTVRAFYLDIAQWAADDPARWAQWAAPCPVRAEEIPHAKEVSRRKARMDQRTRERLPVLPVLLRSAAAEREASAARLAACRAVQSGELFSAGGQELRRAVLSPKASARIWAEDPATSTRRDLTLQEHRGFWAWAAIEVLRHSGIRIEELTELSHHSLIQYRLPATGELIPLLQIAPSKTDAERLLVISPELADVLSAIITRIRDSSGAVPLVVSYDDNEKVWNPPMPLLFQRRLRAENRPITAQAIRQLLDIALDRSGLTDASGQPLRFAPHDFRRLLITDAIMHGMPPHIAQLVAGHRDINTTMGYKTVYPEEVINGHRAFIARRRALRPSQEYRTPTDAEWEEFLGHFERRRLALGDCGRAWGTSCLHEHSCVRCPLLRVSPDQRPRLVDIRDNLIARIDEARREGWLGEAEGLKVSLAAANAKLAQVDRLAARRTAAVGLGMPVFRDIAGRTAPAKDPA